MINKEVLLKQVAPHITQKMICQLDKYCAILQEQAKLINLTTITDSDDIYIKHYYDSLLMGMLFDFNEEQTLVDVGSGAGFPGIVLKIVYPKLKITLVEPTTKRTNFLNLVIKELQLDDIYVINERAEKYITECRGNFDYATARAVAPLNILLELLTPFVKVKGFIIAMKGSNAKEELFLANNAVKTLNLKLENIHEMDLPNEQGVRNILTFRKEKATNGIYPRIYAKIKKQPL